MPITLAPISRRRFLRSALAGAGAMALAPRLSFAADLPRADPNRLALFSDTHIAADRGSAHKTGVNMWEHFHIAAEQLLAQPARYAALLINGDCAYSRGLAEDYITLIDALKPLRAAGLPIHLGLGNHDDRGNILKALPPNEQTDAGLEDRRVSRLRLPHADFYQLDSLDKVNVTPGVLGEAQLDWLAAQLDAQPDRPALVMLHHNPDNRPLEKRSGLVDTEALASMVEPRRQVKAVFFGHTHVWSQRQRQGLHWVNLPATAYVFKPDQPSGWVDALVGERALRLTLHCIGKHPRDGEVLDLAYRA